MSYRPSRIHLDREKFTLLLDLHAQDITPALADARTAANAHNLKPKTQFHSTVIGFRTGKQIADKFAHLPSDKRTAVATAIETFAQSLRWEFRYTDTPLYIEKQYTGKFRETRQSIIQMLDMPDMNIFYNQLNDALETHFETPPPHVTLYTSSTNSETASMGIGVDTAEALAALHPQRID